MQRRRTKLAFAALVLALVGFACWLYANRDRVSHDTFAQVELGMTAGEIEAVFNRPPDQIVQANGVVKNPATFVTIYSYGPPREVPLRYQVHEWTSADLTAHVIFENGRVVCRYQLAGQPDAWYKRFLRAAKRSVGLR